MIIWASWFLKLANVDLFLVVTWCQLIAGNTFAVTGYDFGFCFFNITSVYTVFKKFCALWLIYSSLHWARSHELEACVLGLFFQITMSATQMPLVNGETLLPTLNVTEICPLNFIFCLIREQAKFYCGSQFCNSSNNNNNNNNLCPVCFDSESLFICVPRNCCLE